MGKRIVGPSLRKASIAPDNVAERKMGRIAVLREIVSLKIPAFRQN
jgi:hypothetical protein